MVFFQISFVILTSAYVGLSSDIFENLLRNCPMFALFTMDSLQNSDVSRTILELASTEILTPRMIITEGSYNLLPYVDKDLINFVIVPEENFTGLLNLVHACLQQLNNAKVVFVLPSRHSVENIWNCVQWCWARKIVNVLVAVQGSKVKFDLYTYNPIPLIQIIEIPNNVSFSELFPKGPKRFDNFPVRTLRKYDFPRTFRYINYKGDEVYGGYLWKIFYTWATKYNVQLHFENSSGSDVLDRTLASQYMTTDIIDVAPHFVGGLQGTVTKTYPVLFDRICIMVPQSPRLPSYLYLYLIFDSSVWYCLICGMIYISLAESIYNIITHNRFDFGLGFCNAILGMSYQTTCRSYFNCKSFKFIHGQVMFLGFILTNLFLSNLSSFLTAILFYAQIETYEDLEKSGLRILVEDVTYKSLVNLAVIPSEWQKLYDPVDRETFFEHLWGWNNSFAYSLSSDRFSLMGLIQKKRIFHQSSICALETIAGLSIRNDAVFMDSINSFIIRIYDVGLYDKYIKDLAYESIEAGILKPFEIYLEPFIPLNIEHFQLSWFLLSFGYLIAFLCFLIEYLIRFVKQKYVNHQKE
ncbi:unnamed protein product [Hermetia illucens]|uniref:Ionotropic receptor n=1 Tax=Hermetia illucens TaxID=343691 RepID=A0A7R8UA43_HERIL|nr:uncharacterized protein LOC119646748 [Hermetia illucens]CAD7077005.1 unnamed protein product [Hermetia illucens]